MIPKKNRRCWYHRSIRTFSSKNSRIIPLKYILDKSSDRAPDIKELTIKLILCVISMYFPLIHMLCLRLYHCIGKYSLKESIIHFKMMYAH